jgi:hypothetical protein
MMLDTGIEMGRSLGGLRYPRILPFPHKIRELVE